MGIFDLLRKKAVQSSVFSFFNNTVYPGMKEDEHLRAYYTSWVYACVNAIADDVASMNLFLKKHKGKDVEQVEDNPAIKLLRYVNAFTSSGDLLYSTAGFLKLNGNAFWYMVKNGNSEPSEIWPLRPDKVKVVKSEKNFIGGYVYRNEKGTDVPFKTDEIIHFKKFNPLSPHRGVGVVKAAALAIDTDQSASKWNYNQFKNSAIPSGLLTTEQVLDKNVFTRIKEQWQSKYGGIQNAHKVALLEAGLDFKKVSLSPAEMDYLEQRQFSRDEIMAMFRVPKTVLGITDDVNRANAEATDYVFAKRVVEPEIRFIVDKLNEFYLPLFDLSPDEYFFDYEDPVPENTELDIKRRESGLKWGYYTINEVRAEDGLDPVAWGDIPYLANNFWPIDQLGYKEPVLPFGEDEGKQAKNTDKLIARRNKFLTKKIVENQKVFEGLLQDRKSFLIKRIGKKKTFKKDVAQNLVRFLFESWDDWIGILHGPITEALKDTLAFGGKRAISQVESDITFNLNDPRAKKWLEENSLVHATSIASSVKEDLRERILKAFDEGLGSEDIADTIKDFFDDQTAWRALRIARTEVMSGYGQGTLEGYRQSGVVATKKWLSAGDCCPECDMNTKEGFITLEREFSSGDLVPPAHPSCRCSIQPGV